MRAKQPQNYEAFVKKELTRHLTDDKPERTDTWLLFSTREGIGLSQLDPPHLDTSEAITTLFYICLLRIGATLGGTLFLLRSPSPDR